ncbi:MAG: hypothetical protein ACHQZR_09110 [Candidatus Limnocylindrales bacterium]
MSAAVASEPEASVTVALAGVLLLILGMLVSLGGLALLVLGAFARTAIDDAIRNGNLSSYSADIISFVEGVIVVFGVVVLLYGLGELVAGIGVLRKRGWGRVLGIVLAAVAGLFTTFGVLGSMRNADARGGLIVLLVFALAYWFIVGALALGGRAFRHG